MQTIMLNQLILENLHLFEVVLPKQVQLHPKLSDSLPIIEGDPEQIQQVVMNLIINGVEAIGEQPGSVTVSTTRQILTENDNRFAQHIGEPLPSGQYVCLGVTNTGCGMDEKTLSKIFDPFLTTKFAGPGLGLAAVSGIIQAHKGGLLVESSSGHGTTYRLFFPTSKQELSSPTTEVPPTTTDKKQGLVLVIDDEEAVRIAVTDILKLEDLQVITAENGRDGLALYQEQQQEIDLIILDLSMPGLSGYETLVHLQKINPIVQVLLSSGYSQVEATNQFGDLHVAGFLQKPYNTDYLLEIVQQHLP